MDCTRRRTPQERSVHSLGTGTQQEQCAGKGPKCQGSELSGLSQSSWALQGEAPLAEVLVGANPQEHRLNLPNL